MHGAVKISSEGFSTFQSDGRWNIQFTQLSVDRLRADRDLIQALPESLRKVLAELNPTGSINLQGSLGFERTGRSDEPLHATWNVRLGLQQSNLQLGGIGVENVHGQVALLGGFDGKRLQSRGELAVDALNYREFQLTQVMGPIWIDDGASPLRILGRSPRERNHRYREDRAGKTAAPADGRLLRRQMPSGRLGHAGARTTLCRERHADRGRSGPLRPRGRSREKTICAGASSPRPT